MGQARPTFERRQLGMMLRRLREDAKKTQQDVADRIGKSRSWVAALEDGGSTTTQEVLVTLLDLYGLMAGRERQTVLAIGAEARKRQKKRAHIDVLPDTAQRFSDMEQKATEINCFETGIIPGQLQCESYARAVLREGEGIWWAPNDREGEDRLIYRLERLEKLFDPARAKTMRFVLTEDALHASMGKREVMRDQLEHLLTLIGRYADLTIRVLPNDEYPNPARGRNLLIFGFAGRGEPIGYTEGVIDEATYYDHEHDTSRMLRAFYRVWELALSRAASRNLIERIYQEL